MEIKVDNTDLVEALNQVACDITMFLEEKQMMGRQREDAFQVESKLKEGDLEGYISSLLNLNYSRLQVPSANLLLKIRASG